MYDGGMLREMESLFKKSVDVTRYGVYSGDISTKQGKEERCVSLKGCS